ncbi:MAG: asparagine synthase (glutamine-hydrolyzing) [Ferruginibacter sp.]
MCGILGILPSINKEIFKTALDAIAHRGPDGYGIWENEDKTIMLGHRRLAILDLSEKGRQPMISEKYTITFNGEIYNFIEIRKELLQKGYQFVSDSDTEVIIAAYDAWGSGCLGRFNGMWAFAIWDNEARKLFIARDRYGKKPLFYSFTNRRFVFGSEMKAVTPFLPDVQISAHFEWCKENTFLYESTPKTLIQGVDRFPAASFAYFTPGQTELHPQQYYCTIDHLRPVPSKYDQQVEAFRELFTDACALRMRSDVPIGTALSGGLDSSAVFCTMAEIGKHTIMERINHDWQHAFVACFPGSFLDERRYAQQVVDHVKTKATFLNIDPVEGVDQLIDDMYYFEELYVTSPIPMMRTYGGIKKNGVTVSIDGHGADEMMAGYHSDMLESLLDAGWNISQISNILETFRGYKNIKNADWTLKEKVITYNTTMKNRLKSPKSLLAFFGKALVNKHHPKYMPYPKLGHLNSTLYSLFHQSVLPTLLRNYDRYAMANGVEIRMPFMDHRLVEFSFSIPFTSKIRGGYTKAIIRDAVAPYMPKTIVERKDKIGFNTPITEWLKGPWKSFFMDHIYSNDFRQCSLINNKEVQHQVEKAINDPDADFNDGNIAWYGMQPYFWQKGFLNKVQH